MSLQTELETRSGNKCELCSSVESLMVYEVSPAADITADTCVLLCEKCTQQVKQEVEMDSNHWRCLNDSMWNENAAVQVVAWRMLNRMRDQGWPQDLLDMLYLEPETQTWAEAETVAEEKVPHLDSNGAELQAGDTVTLIKDLNVKGGGFTAKRGTPVRNIVLVEDNPEHIEGKVSGQHIVILTKYVKKAN